MKLHFAFAQPHTTEAHSTHAALSAALMPQLCAPPTRVALSCLRLLSNHTANHNTEIGPYPRSNLYSLRLWLGADADINGTINIAVITANHGVDVCGSVPFYSGCASRYPTIASWTDVHDFFWEWCAWCLRTSGFLDGFLFWNFLSLTYLLRCTASPAA